MCITDTATMFALFTFTMGRAAMDAPTVLDLPPMPTGYPATATRRELIRPNVLLVNNHLPGWVDFRL